MRKDHGSLCVRAQLRLQVQHEHGLPVHGALQGPGRPERARHPGALHGALPLRVQGVLAIHERRDGGGRGEQRRRRQRLCQPGRLLGRPRSQLPGHGVRALRRELPRRDGAPVPDGRARILARELRGAGRRALGDAHQPLALGQEGVRRGGPLVARRPRARLCAAARLRLAAAAARPGVRRRRRRRRLPRGLHQRGHGQRIHGRPHRPRQVQPAVALPRSHLQSDVQVQHQGRHRRPAHWRQQCGPHRLHPRRVDRQAAPVGHVRGQRPARRVGHPPAALGGVRPRHRVGWVRHDHPAHLLRLEPVELGLRDVLEARMRISNQHPHTPTHP